MKAPNDAYATLGVAPDADSATIKRAYRRKAQAKHPDRKGGDAAEFADIANAYAMLSDPRRRLRYDRTGDDRPQEASRTQMLAEILALFFNIVDQVDDVDHEDLWRHADIILGKALAGLRDQKLRKAERLAKRERAAARVRCAPNDALARMLADQLAAERRECNAVDDEIERVGKIRTLLHEFSYHAESRLSIFVAFGVMSSTTGL